MPALAVIASLAPGTSPSRAGDAAMPSLPRPPRHLVKLAYYSGWEAPVIHHSVCGAPWKQSSMDKVTSGGGSWKSVELEATAACSNGSPLAEFVITDGKDHWDKAPEGANYQIHSPGRYLLKHGSISPVTVTPVLLVSDLDETMIGDDEATAAFTRWWLEYGVAAGGRLVYNTGRALDLFQALIAEKGHVLEEPDLLISALGTKIYRKNGRHWEVDPAYERLLGEGWSLDAVREACYASLAAVGKDAMHFRPPTEQNEHKVTCGVRLDVVEQVKGRISASLKQQGVLHRLVVSGSGDWRFMDLVPLQAGKLQALEYARTLLGFTPDQTMACGDSGNDIDMLEGNHLSVVVGNAQPDLLAWAERRRAALAAQGTEGRLLVAEGQRAWGILEALHKFGFASAA